MKTEEQCRQIVITNSENEVLAVIFESGKTKIKTKIIESDGIKVNIGNDFLFEEFNSKEGVRIFLKK